MAKVWQSSLAVWQGAQSNPHACKQTLNSIISLPSSSYSLRLTLFLMVLCIFTESHLKYFSGVARTLTKGWKKTETEVHTECLLCAKMYWQEAGDLVYREESNTVCCVSAASSMRRGHSNSVKRQPGRYQREGSPSLLRWLHIPLSSPGMPA